MDKDFLKEKIELILKKDESLEAEENVITLHDIIVAIINGRKIIAAFVIVALLFGIILPGFTTSYKSIAKIALSFNYQGIEKGLDPHGDKFNISEIKSPAIIDAALNQLDKQALSEKGVKADDLRRYIEIQPIIPGNIVELLEMKKKADKADVKNLEDYSYYPNEFIIQLNVPKEWKLSKGDVQQVLGQIVDTYIENFYTQYTDRQILADIVTNLDYAEYDYPEVSSIVKNQVNTIQSYLSSKSKEANEFRAKSTGLTFQDIIESLNVIENVDLDRMDSLIIAFKLSKDKTNLIKYYEYKIRQAELLQAKKQDEARVTGEMLDKFQKDKNLVVLPGVGQETGGLVEVEGSNSYYDTLAEKYTNAGVESTNQANEINYYKKLIGELQSFDPNVVSVEATNKAEAEVAKLTADISTKIKYWVDIANKTIQEYYESKFYDSAVMKLTPVQVNPPESKKTLYMAVFLVAGLLLGVLVALFKEYWKNSNLGKKAETQKSA